MVAYVETSITDPTRAYWQADGADWIAETDPANGDVGPVNPAAPDWLLANRGTFSWGSGGPAQSGYIADLTSTAWQQIVINQAVAQVSYGYDGVFLDDVGAYLPAGYAAGPYDPAYAIAMMALVVAVADAVHAINPNAYIVVNSGLNVINDSFLGPNDPRVLAYRDAIDAMLLESQFANQIDADATPATTTQDALTDAGSFFPDAAILSVEYSPTLNLDRYLAFCGAQGILPNLPASESLSTSAAPPVMGSALADVIVMTAVQHIAAGLQGNDRITGSRGADKIFGHSGNDILLGVNGADSLVGDSGNDRLTGGAGNDTLVGGAGQDSFVFANNAGFDRLRDFHPGQDHIIVTSGAESLAEVGMVDTAGGLRLSFGTTSVLLTGVTLASFDTADLLFV